MKDIYGRLEYLKRPIDLYWITQQNLNNDIPQNLLFSTSSIQLSGPEISTIKVMYNSEFVLTHFKRYNPSFAPDLMYSDLRSRVCALKNLTRCFGLISLIENGIFSRNIDECLILAKVKNKKIYDLLL